jgi:hypothetical protein
MVSLDVKGAFDAAWWPSILSNLRDLRCPKNLYILTLNYFSDRIAIFHANTYKVERKASMGFPQGSCCGPGLSKRYVQRSFEIRLLRTHEGHSLC